MTDFDDIVGADFDALGRERLRRAHEALVAAGPPPELPRSLARPPQPWGDNVVSLSSRRRRGWIVALAAAIAVALFGLGYLAGDRGNGSSLEAERVVSMKPTAAAPANAAASIDLGEPDTSGNTPMLVHLTNLEALSGGAYYTLWVTRNGRAVAPCGSFVVGGHGTTDVHFSVYYDLDRFDGMAVTFQPKGHHDPGRVLLRSV